MNDASTPHDLRPDDRRRIARPRTLKAGTLLFGGFQKTAFNCLVLDLSESGARIETAVTIDTPEAAQLQIRDEILGPLNKRWACGNRIGFAFAPRQD